MTSSAQSSRWKFAGLSLGPIGALAILALRALRTDEAALESTARRELSSLSARLATQLELRLASDLAPKLDVATVDFANPTINPAAVTTSWRLDAAGDPVDVYFAPEVPVPPSWWLALNAEQRMGYQKALGSPAVDSTPNSPAAPAFLSEEAQRIWNFDRQCRTHPETVPIVSVTAGNVALLPSGLSLTEASIWRQLQAPMVSDALPALAANLRKFLLTEHPGTWPELRTRLEQTDLAARPEIQSFRALGDFRAGEQERLAAWRNQWPAAEWHPEARWIVAGTNLLLATLEAVPQTSTNQPPHTRTATWIVSFAPAEALAGTVRTLAAQLAPETPPYARMQVSLAGGSLTALRAGIPSTSAFISPGPFRPLQVRLPGGTSIPGWAGYELADRDLLLADHRRRRWLLSGLVIGSALISLAGFWQLQRALRRQQELNEQQANFVSSVSHELRSPVASLGLMVEQLRGVSGLDAAGRTEYLRLIARECRRLGQLIQNVLATRRLESDRREFLAEPLDLGRLVTDTLAAFAPQAEEQSVRLEESITAGRATGTVTENVYEVLGDSLALQQALTNLLDNALKHSPAGGVISVQLQPSESGRRVQLSVTDQGPGVPPEDRERIFQRFVRRGSELRRETEGIGLGLALVRGTLELHGGRVWCEAGESGRGARFIVELPLELVSRPSTSAPQQS